MTQTAQSLPQAVFSASDLAIPVLPKSKYPIRLKQWELINLAGEGGLSQIFRARPAGSPADQPASYALKMLSPAWQDDPQAIRLLQREALVGQSVSHPHLIPILFAAVQQHPRFVVMPWLDGATLEQRLTNDTDCPNFRGHHHAAMVDENGTVPFRSAFTEPKRPRKIDLPQSLWIARQTAEALDALHRSGWMHGDVKPDNIMLSPEGHVTLIDLSFARRADETGSAIDRCVLGTFHYIAPELLTSALRADIRSDIYSLGAMLFRILAGRLPFESNDLAELATQHKQSLPPNLHRLAPHLPRGLTNLVHSMLSKEPLRRPQTPREVSEILARLEIETFTERMSGQ